MDGERSSFDHGARACVSEFQSDRARFIECELLARDSVADCDDSKRRTNLVGGYVAEYHVYEIECQRASDDFAESKLSCRKLGGFNGDGIRIELSVDGHRSGDVECAREGELDFSARDYG